MVKKTALLREEIDISKLSNKTISNWHINNLASDQKEIVLQIMSKLKEWFEWDGVTLFHPLRLTVTGKPCTGKSVIIKTIRNLCYHMFHTHACVQVCAPTGGVAYNAGGQTCHQQWGISRNPLTAELSSDKKYICKECMVTLFLILDEYSLLDAYSIAAMENNLRQTIYSSRCTTIPWGGIPVIVTFGNIFQLSSISPGVLVMMDNNKKEQVLNRTKNLIVRTLTSSGWDQYIILAQKVLSLSIPKRVDSTNKELLSLLDSICREDKNKILQDSQITHLLNLRINNSANFSYQEQQIIKKDQCVFLQQKKTEICIILIRY